MKRIIYFSLPVLFILLLTACSFGAGTQDATTEVSREMGKTPVVMEKGPAADLCASVKHADIKSDCENTVLVGAEQYVYNEAITYFDSGQCDQLSSASRQESCKAEIEKSGIKGPIADEEKQSLDQVKQSGNTAACAEMKTTGLQEYCEGLGGRQADLELLNSIYRDPNRSAADCDKIQTEDIRLLCTRRVGT